MSCPHIDLINPDLYQKQTPFNLFAELREKDPVHWHEDPETNVGFWAITKREHLDFVCRNPHIFSSEARSCVYAEWDDERVKLLSNMLLNMDPPKHIAFRKVISPLFKPGVIKSFRPLMEKHTRKLLDEVIPRGECDFVTEVGVPLTQTMIFELFGAPLDDREMINKWAVTFLGQNDKRFAPSLDDVFEAERKFCEYGFRLAEIYKGSTEDNLTVQVVNANIDGESLTAEEFGFFFFLLLLAGPETTYTALTNGMKLLIDHPDQLQMLIDNPKMIEQAVEEILRYESPVTLFRRTAMKNIELGGKQINAGDKVVFFYSGANHDEDVFDQPEKFDITRGSHMDLGREHRTFGTGEHFCLGAHMARMELNVMFEQILPRMRNPRLAGERVRLRSRSVTTPLSMPILFDPA